MAKPRPAGRQSRCRPHRVNLIQIVYWRNLSGKVNNRCHCVNSWLLIKGFSERMLRGVMFAITHFSTYGIVANLPSVLLRDRASLCSEQRFWVQFGIGARVHPVTVPGQQEALCLRQSCWAPRYKSMRCKELLSSCFNEKNKQKKTLQSVALKQ